MSSGHTDGQDRVAIRQMPTGVPGLDEILGGGLPEYSFNIVAGSPGCGKTTLVHQFMFEGEPAVKMLRYQQQFSFFDQTKLEDSIHFINLSEFVLGHDLEAVLQKIVMEVEARNAGIVVVDSFRTVVRRAQASSAEMELQGFVQRLALHLTSFQATSFLVGEYVEAELRDNPVFTVADGLIWLYQSSERNSIVRKMQVMKMRGQETVPGLHTFRITQAGVQTFPRTFGLAQESGHVKGAQRVSMGVHGLDDLMGGGIPEGNSVLLAGPSGSGKSVMATHFIAEGLRQGEPGVVAIFEELPAEFTRRAAQFGIDFDGPQKDGTLKVIYIRPLDLSVDETVHAIVEAVKKIGAKRVLIDSMVGFEMALAPDFRHEFRESLYRMIGALTRLGVTVVSTVEVEETFTSMGLSNFAISFLSDVIVRLRYVSIDGRLRKMLLVVKMRGSAHSNDMTEYTITEKGVASGIPGPWACPEDEGGSETQKGAARPPPTPNGGSHE